MKVVFFLVSVICLIGGFLAFGKEYGVAYFSRSSDFANFQELSSNSAPISLPYSARGMRELFSVCGKVQQGLIYRLQPSDVQAVIDGKCLAFSDRSLVKNPTYSAAYTIRMMSSTAPQDIRAAMVNSQKTSGYESWDAKLRLEKSILLEGTGDADFDAALRADIVFLAQSNGGRTWLAKLYRELPSAHAILSQTIQTRPNAEKMDFLQKVRAGG